MTHIEALELDHIPEHLIVLGVATLVWNWRRQSRRSGSRVTVVDRIIACKPRR